MSPSALESAPTGLNSVKISIPEPGILLVLINRPRQLNSLSVEAGYELDSVFKWFDKETSLRVAILSGVGKAFCVGADLKGKAPILLLGASLSR
jgi:enoyl-CoA hydratase/carnithine racemase